MQLLSNDSSPRWFKVRLSKFKIQARSTYYPAKGFSRYVCLLRFILLMHSQIYRYSFVVGPFRYSTSINAPASSTHCRLPMTSKRHPIPSTSSMSPFQPIIYSAYTYEPLFCPTWTHRPLTLLPRHSLCGLRDILSLLHPIALGFLICRPLSLAHAERVGHR